LELKAFHSGFSPAGVRSYIGGGLLDHGAFLDVVGDEFEFRSMCHVPDLSLDISEKRLEQQILILDSLLVVKHGLHCLMVGLLSIHG